MNTKLLTHGPLAINGIVFLVILPEFALPLLGIGALLHAHIEWNMTQEETTVTDVPRSDHI